MKIQLTLKITDEAYPRILYLLKHMEGVEIIEDIHTEEKTENLHKNENK